MKPENNCLNKWIILKLQSTPTIIGQECMNLCNVEDQKSNNIANIKPKLIRILEEQHQTIKVLEHKCEQL